MAADIIPVPAMEADPEDAGCQTVISKDPTDMFIITEEDRMSTIQPVRKQIPGRMRSAFCSLA